VGALSERVVPAGELFDADDRPCAQEILGTDRVEVMVAAMERYLLAAGPEPDPVAHQVQQLVAWAEEQHGLTRAEELAAHAGVSLRTLQRMFTEYVGIGPKWVIARYRILDAAAAAHAGGPVDWAALAARLGFTEQAHLTRVFTQVVGSPPETYRRQA
jgi:AraC-like DNA-binding protein